MDISEPIADAADMSRNENVRAGYQAAISLWIFEEERVWNIFNVMLVANSILVALIGLSATATPQRPLPIFVPIIGLILCVAWFLLAKRGFDYRIYWVLSAREFEEKYLADSVKIASRGASFADGKPVQFEIAGKPLTFRLSMWSRLFRAAQVSYVIIIVFVIMYVASLLQGLI
jgi:hypothetical protein